MIVRRGWVSGMAALAVLSAGAAQAAEPPSSPAGVPQTRTTRVVAPGVTLTTINRGSVSPADYYTVNVGIPTSSDVPPSPDPDAVTAVIGTRETADGVVAQLKTAGWTARTEAVRMPRFADTGPGLVGYRVRVGHYATEAEATAVSKQLAAAKFKPSVVFTGQDGDPTTGPWAINALTVDFRSFTGAVAESHDATLAGRRTTAQIAQDTGALAAVNGGFFIIGAADGVVGDSAGIVVSHGRLLHDATNGRVAAILRDGGRRLSLERLWTRIDLVSRGRTHQVAGLNRAPGLIRDCGGRPGDTPTSAPLMDVTCKNPNEMIAFTPEFGSPLPTGPGSSAVLDASGRVVSEGPRTAVGTVPAGGTVLEAIGTEATWLDENATVGARLRLRTRITGPGGRTERFGPSDSVVNGGPQLVHDGRVSIAPKADGLIHPGDPSYFYGWGIRRNPRTMIGVDRRGRLLLVETDGRYAAHSQGLSIPEAGELMRSLGAVEAMNLDGGGSSTMVVGGNVVNTPSDATGQRPVGDAVVILPR